MGAIAGILRFGSEREEEPSVRAAMGKMAHRAADGIRIHAGPGVGLAHGALHSDPGSGREGQPVEIDGRWVLVVDGRIDNREALARELGMDEAGKARAGDDVIFAQAWLRWGDDFWRRLVGEFAMAIWDKRTRALKLFRDRVGQRPLYFASSRSLLAFASEPEPLLGLDGISRTCDEDALAYLLAANFQPEDLGATFYRDVRRLLPGEALTASHDGAVRVARCCSMEPGTTLRLRDPREYVDAFREVFGEAVRCRLRSLHRPSLMLSGGIDSASVLGAARLQEAQAGRLRPISMVMDAAHGVDENANILRMHEGADGIRLDLDGLARNPLSPALVEAAWDHAHPIDNSLLYARLVHLAARDAGSNVVLDGVDGDVVMHADDHYVGALSLAGHPFRAWREARMASSVHTYLRGTPAWSILLRGVAAKLQPTWMTAWRYRLHDRLRGDAVLGPWIDARFASRLQLRSRSVDRAISQRRTGGSRSEGLRALWWGPGITRSLEGADRTASFFGVEARHPWCDQRVLEFFLSLPETCVVREGWTKWLPRSAFAGVLGAEVAWHSGKTHFGPLVTRHVLKASADRVSHLLARARDRLGGVADSGSLETLRTSWGARESNPGDVDVDQVLLTATLVAWMDRFELDLG